MSCREAKAIRARRAKAPAAPDWRAIVENLLASYGARCRRNSAETLGAWSETLEAANVALRVFPGAPTRGRAA